MAWIESHQELARHPKTKKLAREIGENVRSAIGLLHLLWWWAMDYAQDGDLTKFGPDDIADGVMWEGDPLLLLNSFINAGFIDENDDETIVIHDWEEYAGRLIEKRKDNAERKKKSRARHADVTQTSQGSHGATNQPTVPNQPNQPNQTEPTNHENAGARLVREYEQIFSRLPNKVLIDDLLEYMDKGMELELLISALKETRRYNGGHKYTLGILNRQFDSGIRTVAQAEINEAERQSTMGGLRYESTIHRQPNASTDEPDPNSVEAFLRERGAT